MTYQEITDKYSELFVILIEKAGRETGNTSYQKVAEILGKDESKQVLEKAVRDEVDFKMFVCLMIVMILFDIYDHQIENWTSEESSEKLLEFYELYLKKATKKFCTKYGLEPFDNPGMAFKMITKHIELNG